MTETKRQPTIVTVLASLAHVSTVVALAALFFQMNSDGKARRAERSLSYVQQYSSDPLSRHRFLLDKAWLKYSAEISTANASGGLRPADAEKLLKVVMEDHDLLNPNEPAQISINELAYFFDQVVICVQVDACDKEIVDRYFLTTIREFWAVYKPVVIDARGSNSSSLGTAIEDYLENY